MFCPNCGEDAPPSAAFCAKCGTSVGQQQIVAPPPSGDMPAGYVAPVVAYPQAPVLRTQDETTAMLSMIFGILSLAGLGIFAGIPAIILGNVARGKIRASGGRLTGEGMAKAGIILGWVSCGLMVIVILFMIIVFVVAAASSNLH